MKTKHISTSVDENTYNKVCFVAKHEFRTAAGLIRFLLIKHIKQFEKANAEIKKGN